MMGNFQTWTGRCLSITFMVMILLLAISPKDKASPLYPLDPPNGADLGPYQPGSFLL